MKRIATLLAALLLSFGWAQAQVEDSPEGTWRFMEVTGPNYHGYAFPNDWDVDLTVEGQDGRFTPDDPDIAKAEKLMQKKIAYLNRYHENQEGKVPVIDEHLAKYERQYVGFTDIHGYRIIYINCLWDESLKGKLGRDIVRTTGGGPYYWSVKVNLDTEKVYGLSVNDQNEPVRYLPREKKPGPRISKPKDEKAPKRVRKTGIKPNPAELTF